MTVLVLVDYDNGHIKPVTRSAITAAAQLGEVHALVAGESVDTIATQAAAIEGVAKVLKCDSASYAFMLAEPMAELLAAVAAPYDHIVAPATAVGKSVIPRAAALLDVQPVSDVMQVVSGDCFVRPIYAGNILATVQSLDSKKLLTVRATAFEAAPAQGGAAVIEELAPPPAVQPGTRFVEVALSASERPELESARVVVSGGRSLQSAENFEKLLFPLADRLGAAVGASRAAVDAGFIANDHQVGQTGKIVAPELYIAVGISGAIQHLAGMKDSKVIVAINKDPEAPIFSVADYGLVGDLFDVLPRLQALLG